ncbi:unnamed protein product [Cuscuta campestris]|uniref:Myb/SANT-like DNA-binding domain-containing protein n=1 Tax=Cuscuta campestris TaxID=132261 RepID=A0A484LES8_9ASTE|nr:unnamed protein product [Cuscuta campestris]
MYPSMGSGMIGLEMSLHHHIPQPPPPQQQQQQQPPNLTMAPFDQHHPPVGVHTYANKPKTHGLSLNSDDDEPAAGGVGPTPDRNTVEDGKRKMSPWQRMKWTDEMVRLLIMVVYYIGDEGTSEGNNSNNNPEKKGGVLQKKGKWKSVSRAMMERGFYVSPQQCEDKFNDLNKRYKRVNDILGKGTSCRVVENHALLETMDLSPKMKEEVKKLLNSKHLFFREMCAYHNSCSQSSSEPPNLRHQKCLHSSNAPRLGPSSTERDETVKTHESREEEEDDDDDEDGDDDESNDDSEESELEERSQKTQKTGGWAHQLSSELTDMCQDGNRSPLEKRQWIRGQMVRLEEQRVMYESERLELQKQRLQWEKYKGRKERGMDREKLVNERKRLENERLALFLQQKELELLDDHLLHHQRTSDPSSVTG